ncbi:hypothetical protein GCM10010124_21030 [Pilimelia terevasa]|uniref:SGNH hydrolase-type esterase domain-containing protein n=1 Tax=Pilimelia terevasa TaxID=53372 RepID=A0A8J3BQ94_9ACTN|nr:GDSL-type esterase/lipase family protein [Pilimelia terevasa]GGK28196.1 hypothetical protein GCM10010124_21030 [Pilimelia terevasa]
MGDGTDPGCGADAGAFAPRAALSGRFGVGRPAAGATAAVVLAAVLALLPAPTARQAAAARDPVRILALGDSLTWGTAAPHLDGWRRGLRARLVRAGVPVDFVGSRATGAFADNQHDGRPGWRIADLRRAAPALVRAADPDVILLHVGTNDVKLPGPGVAGAPARLGLLLDQLLRLAPAAPVLVAQVANSPRVDIQPRLARFNRSLAVVAARRGPRVRVVDMAALGVFSDFADSLHPNRRGYAVLAHRWYRALQPVLRRGGAPWSEAGDPQRSRYQCARVRVDAHRRLRGAYCRWWHLRPGPGTAAGRPGALTWQTVRVRTVTVAVRRADGTTVRRVTRVRYWSAV